MREIKFRVWSNNIMSDLDLFHNGDVLDLMDSPTMQYTGLKDKNGKEIYEGDYCKAHAFDEFDGDHNIEGVIVIGIDGVSIGDMWVYNTSHFDEPCIEIIGNIYENKELLENET